MLQFALLQDDPSRIPKSAVVSPEGEILAGGRQAMFQRSISEIASSTNMDENIGAAEAANNRLSRRKRNNSLSEGGISLLKNPSASMVKLIQGANKALNGGSNSIDRSLQNMVMCFVIQRHDLMSLKYAMKQGLRKAACRVYALQVCILVLVMSTISFVTRITHLYFFNVVLKLIR